MIRDGVETICRLAGVIALSLAVNGCDRKLGVKSLSYACDNDDDCVDNYECMPHPQGDVDRYVCRNPEGGVGAAGGDAMAGRDVSDDGDDDDEEPSGDTGTSDVAVPGGEDGAASTDTADEEGDEDSSGGGGGGSETPTSSMEFLQVSAGYQHTCGVTASNDVKCWGVDRVGESSPPSDKYREVRAGHDRTCGVVKCGDGTCEVDCWGDGDAGGELAPVSQLDVGDPAVCGVDQAGDVICNEPDFEIARAEYEQVYVGHRVTCAIRADADSTANETVHCSENIQVPSGGFEQVAVGLDFLCARGDPGDSEGVECSKLEERAPIDIPESRSSSFMDIDVSTGSQRFACGVTEDHEVSCWGPGADVVTSDANVAPPTEGEFVELSIGVEHVCGIRSDGKVRCWGEADSDAVYPP